MSEHEPISVMVVDDHQVVRKGLIAYIDLEDDMRVIAEAADGAEAMARYREHKPDVVLLDLQMEPVNGIDALRAIRQDDAKARVIILTSFVDSSHVVPALEAGATGYLIKTAEPEEIVRAIRCAIAGKPTYDPDVMQAMADGFRQRAMVSDLTNREMDVLRLIAQGKSNQEIGEELFIGLKTVKTHVSNILAKLNVVDRTQAAVYALRQGLVTLREK